LRKGLPADLNSPNCEIRMQIPAGTSPAGIRVTYTQIRQYTYVRAHARICSVSHYCACIFSVAGLQTRVSRRDQPKISSGRLLGARNPDKTRGIPPAPRARDPDQSLWMIPSPLTREGRRIVPKRKWPVNKLNIKISDSRAAPRYSARLRKGLDLRHNRQPWSPIMAGLTQIMRRRFFLAARNSLRHAATNRPMGNARGTHPLTSRFHRAVDILENARNLKLCLPMRMEMSAGWTRR